MRISPARGWRIGTSSTSCGEEFFGLILCFYCSSMTAGASAYGRSGLLCCCRRAWSIAVKTGSHAT